MSINKTKAASKKKRAKTATPKTKKRPTTGKPTPSKRPVVERSETKPVAISEVKTGTRGGTTKATKKRKPKPKRKAKARTPPETKQVNLSKTIEQVERDRAQGRTITLEIPDGMSDTMWNLLDDVNHDYYLDGPGLYVQTKGRRRQTVTALERRSCVESDPLLLGWSRVSATPFGRWCLGRRPS